MVETPKPAEDASLERIKADRDYELKIRELALKEQELLAKREEVIVKRGESSLWRSPVLYTAAAAALGVYVNLYTSYQSSQTQITLEAQKSEASLILQMLNTGGDPDKAAKNLELLVKTKLIRNEAQRNGILAYLDARRPGEGAALGTTSQPGAKGFYGGDTRRGFDEFPQAQSDDLYAKYGYVGVLLDEGSAFCNAILVDRDLVMTVSYCFMHSKTLQFAIPVRNRQLRSANVTGVVFTKEVLDSGMPGGGSGIAFAKLDKPLGDEIGWVKRFAAKAERADKLDLAAVPIASEEKEEKVKKPSETTHRLTISGTATNDANCSVILPEPQTGFFAHRCVSPMGSAGAAIFRASTGELLGMVSRYDPRLDIDFAILAKGIPEAIQQARVK
jgi:hypothetical protein